MLDILKKIVEISIVSNTLYIIIVFAIIIITLKYYAKSQPFSEQRKLRSARHLLAITAMLLMSVTLAFYYKEYRTATQYAYKGYDEKLNTEQAKKEVAEIVDAFSEDSVYMKKDTSEFKPIVRKNVPPKKDVLEETASKVFSYLTNKGNKEVTKYHIEEKDVKVTKYGTNTKAAQEKNKISTNRQNGTLVDKDTSIDDNGNKLPSTTTETTSNTVVGKPTPQPQPQPQGTGQPPKPPVNTEKDKGEQEQEQEQGNTDENHIPTPKPPNKEEVANEQDKPEEIEQEDVVSQDKLVRALTIFQNEVYTTFLAPLRTTIRQQIVKQDTLTDEGTHDVLYTITPTQQQMLKQQQVLYQKELQDLLQSHERADVMAHIKEFDTTFNTLYSILIASSSYTQVEYEYIVQKYAESEYLLLNI